ncbi:uncharacterized protein LOC131302878 [Rhododendron vialii]|uniref:uncharacterized protein LOC131302878 n=1 Tax=Rhododendron vialii TaxID=182163 RepID=UPI00265EB1C4|nr:uncharacterized protein LOC131302878 [Rhododendron vialii]
MAVEKGLDEYNRPKLKIVYVDPTGGDETWVTGLQYKFLDSETDAVEKEEGLCLDRPRLIFVIQDKDFWPGTDSDPEAIERRLVKEEKKSICSLPPPRRRLKGAVFEVVNLPWTKRNWNKLLVENLELSCSLISPPVDSSCSVFQIAPKKKMKISQLQKVIRSSDRDAPKMKQFYLGVGGGEIGQKKVRSLIRSFYPFDDAEPVYDYSSGEEVVYEEYAREDSLYWLSECKRLTLLEDENFEQFVRSAMVVEKELDEYNRPKLKIIYVDPIGGDERWVTLLQYRFLNTEIDAVEKEEGLCLDRPRFIFVIQDKDFWPGTDSYPEAIERRLVKEEKKVITYDGDLNSELPGYSFLVDNHPWLKAEKHMFSAAAPKKKQLKKVKRCFLRSCEPPLDEKELEQVALVENLESSCLVLSPSSSGGFRFPYQQSSLDWFHLDYRMNCLSVYVLCIRHAAMWNTENRSFDGPQ